MLSTDEKMKDHMLADHGLRKTSFRKEVLSIFLENKGKAVTNATIEDSLKDFDRITLYRTLKSFEEKGLIHIALDSKGLSRYALCDHNCNAHQHQDTHAHFHCDNCGNTTCLDEMHDGYESLVPQGYQIKDVQITFSGVCQSCT